MADISQSSWSEVDASNNQAAPLGWTPGTMLPSQVEPTAQAMMGAMKRTWDRANPVNSTSGASGVYQLTLASLLWPASYVQGELFAFKAHQDSVGNDTFQVNGLGALPIYKAQVGPLALVPIMAQDIRAGQMVQLAQNSSNWLLLNPSAMKESQVYGGNPNGYVAGVAGTIGALPPDMCWDTTNGQWWICTTTGTAAAAVWSNENLYARTISGATTIQGATLAAGTGATVTGAFNVPTQSPGDGSTKAASTAYADASSAFAALAGVPGFIFQNLGVI